MSKSLHSDADIVSSNHKTRAFCPHSIFRRSPLNRFVSHGLNLSDNVETDFSVAERIFVNETSQALRICYDGDAGRTSRTEPLRAYIIKLLLCLGMLPQSYAFSVVARLIECCVLCPDLTLNAVIENFAVTHATEKTNVSRLIDKFFDVYDDACNLTNKVSCMTGTRPITAKDVLCDIAVFARINYYEKIYADEKLVR